MEIKAVFRQLKQQFGSHSAVARAIEIDPRTYRRWRSVDNPPQIAMKYLRGLIALDRCSGTGDDK